MLSQAMHDYDIDFSKNGILKILGKVLLSLYHENIVFSHRKTCLPNLAAQNTCKFCLNKLETCQPTEM